MSRPTTAGFDIALDGQYPPGSTFKIVTSADLLEHGFTPSSTVSCPAKITVDGRDFHNFEGEAAASLTLQQAFAASCNNAFIGSATRLSVTSFAKTAREFGLGAAPHVGLEAFGGRVPDPTSDTERAATAIGQARVVVSPLAMACVAATVATGRFRAPTLVAGTHSVEVSPAIAPKVIADLRSMMAAVVTSGTAAGRGLPAGTYGKTGTAEFGTADPPADPRLVRRLPRRHRLRGDRRRRWRGRKSRRAPRCDLPQLPPDLSGLRSNRADFSHRADSDRDGRRRRRDRATRDGRVVFVNGALPGERVKAEVHSEHRNHAMARVVEVLDPSPHRLQPPCPEVERGCGACPWQHIEPAAQQRFKADIVRDALRRIGRFEPPEFAPTVPLAPWAFRTTVRAVVNGRAGFRRAHSHDSVAVDGCLVAHPLVAELIVDGRYPGADEVLLRCGARTGERLAAVTPGRASMTVPDDVRSDHVHELAAGDRGGSRPSRSSRPAPTASTRSPSS